MTLKQGLYLHIPFCKQACNYCNFHFSTSSRGREEVLNAINREIALREDELTRHPLQSIYLGGGTPSLLSSKELDQIFAQICTSAGSHLPALEITLEANPDDLNASTVADLAASPVNRLSIGIQSFQQADLDFMKRAHTAAESEQALQLVQEAGFDDLSIDLIYGSPTTSETDWRDNLSRAVDYGIPHISAYALTVEPKTALAHQIKTGQTAPVDEALAARQFEILIEVLGLAGYEQYEISNFALPGHYSRHNSSYWSGQPYIGIGPSAHSFDGKSERRWNVANNALYQQLINQLESPSSYATMEGLYTTEVLSKADRYNERVMTSLRTQWGINLSALTNEFGPEFGLYFQEQLMPSVKLGQVVIDDSGQYKLTPAARFLADGIAAQAFWV